MTTLTIFINPNLKPMKRILSMLFVACMSISFIGSAYAATDAAAMQQTNKRQVSGLVTDEAGLPVPGASVVSQANRTIGTVTDVDGTFSMMVPADTKVLEVASLGYETVELVLTNASVYNVVLEEDSQMLQETVVVGYGTMKKTEVASAISSVKSEDFIKTPSSNAAELIKGKVPGLVVNTPD